VRFAGRGARRPPAGTAALGALRDYARCGAVRSRSTVETLLITVVLFPVSEIADVARAELRRPCLIRRHDRIVEADRKEYVLPALSFVGALQVGADQVGVPQVGAVQVGAAQVGVEQVGAVQVGVVAGSRPAVIRSSAKSSMA
jgi:hypothetical protein